MDYLGKINEYDLNIQNDYCRFSDEYVYGYSWSSNGNHFIAVRLPNHQFVEFKDTLYEFTNEEECKQYARTVLRMFNDMQPQPIQNNTIRQIVAERINTQNTSPYDNGDVNNIECNNMFMGIKQNGNTFHVCVDDRAVLSYNNIRSANRVFSLLKDDIKNIILQRWRILTQQ